MKITQITVHAETRFNDEFEAYRNHCPSVSMVADVSDEEDIDAATTRLFNMASVSLDDERHRIITRRKQENEEASRRFESERMVEIINRSRREILGLERIIADEMAREELVRVKWRIEDSTRGIEMRKETIERVKAKLAERGEVYRDEDHKIEPPASDIPF